ncbi:Acetyl esterase/lipase [Pontibacter akesuensis]|uniref:Acetyl esterase/lipase n=2 Tax=Pontibacter akesuensis TaxID=388950 RepID=A0A1I7KVB6_9BACT|nr:alpha/beta hydrolase [Pontibacter akesuensis]GHA78248.1 esterase [Pontibacter akesuensis]SFV01357.1 Acetyl esterase/lipase [Pontibacter akesuensis]
MKSITYYLTLFVIKLKGLKREFSKDPIDFNKLRKEDVHRPKPASFRPHFMRQFSVAETLLTEVKPAATNGFLLLFCPGGAFVYGPARHHWHAAKQLVSQTQCTLWMVDYPKAPENNIAFISENIDAVYAYAVETHGAGKVILVGDSAGGTLLTALTQRLVQKSKALPLALVLISPVMDASFSNPQLDALEKVDPMLSKAGVLSAKRMCAQHYGVDDVRLSPVNGSFSNFPRTLLLVAENDITYPDQQLVVQQLCEAAVEVKVIKGEGMPHIWPILPVMQEARAAFQEMTSYIRRTIAGASDKV